MTAEPDGCLVRPGRRRAPARCSRQQGAAVRCGAAASGAAPAGAWQAARSGRPRSSARKRPRRRGSGGTRGAVPGRRRLRSGMPRSTSSSSRGGPSRQLLPSLRPVPPPSPVAVRDRAAAISRRDRTRPRAGPGRDAGRTGAGREPAWWVLLRCRRAAGTGRLGQDSPSEAAADVAGNPHREALTTEVSPA